MKDLKQYVESQLYDPSLIESQYWDLSSLKESLLDDEDDLVTDLSDIIRNFLKFYYKIDDPISIYKDNGQWYVDVLGSVEIKQDHMDRLTNGLFRFGWVNGIFNCEYSLIRNLDGAPKKCKVLMCNHCDRLKKSHWWSRRMHKNIL